ncbi:MAG TPA: hypothetical protein PLT75_17030 [Spirochaetota bacterium]|nr:hypothetical protein [Spirochaetota bacterium]
MTGNVLNNTHYIILTTRNRKYDFTHPEVFKCTVDDIDFRHTAGHEIDLHLCVIFPKELHIILSMTESYGKPVKNWVTAFKRYLSRFIYEDLTMKWTPGFQCEDIKTMDELKGCIDKVMSLPQQRGIIPHISVYSYITAFP